MAAKTLGAVLRGKTTIDSLLDGIPNDQRAALALLIFMRFAEDNAEKLAVELHPDEPDQESIAELCSRLGENRFYSRSSIDPDAIWADIASQLRFEARSFNDFTRNISDRALSSACKLCDLEPGCLSVESNETIRRATRAMHAIFASLFAGINHIPRTYADIVAGILSPSIEIENKPAICLPAAGQSDLALSFAHLAGKQSRLGATGAELHAYANDTNLQVFASMIFIIEQSIAGNEAAPVDISLSDPLFTGIPKLDGGQYVAAAADWSALQYACYDIPRPNGEAVELSKTRLPWIERLFDEKLPAGKHSYHASSADGFLPTVCELLVLQLLSTVDATNGCAAAIVEAHCNSSATPDLDLRRTLIDNNVLDAVIEFEHIDGQSDRSNQGTALWILRLNRKEDDGILIARLGGDGFKKMCEDLCGEGWNFYDHLGLPIEENPVARNVVEMVNDRNPVDMVGIVVQPYEVAKSEDCTFRFASYQDSIDLNMRFAQKAESWAELQRQLTASVKQSADCDKRFLDALRSFNDFGA